MNSPLVTTDWLALHLEDPDLVIYGPTRFASDFEALINKFIAFIYPACDPGVFIPAALMQLANYFNFIILAASKEPMTSSVLK